MEIFLENLTFAFLTASVLARTIAHSNSVRSARP